MCAHMCVGAAGLCATLDTLIDRIRGYMGVCAGVGMLVCVQPDTASHTQSVFSISYHQVGQLVAEEAGQAIRLGGSRMCNTHPCSKFDHLFHSLLSLKRWKRN